MGGTHHLVIKEHANWPHNKFMLWNIHWLPNTSPKYFLPPLGHLLIFWEAAPLSAALSSSCLCSAPHAFLYKEYTEARKPPLQSGPQIFSAMYLPRRDDGKRCMVFNLSSADPPQMVPGWGVCAIGIQALHAHFCHSSCCWPFLTFGCSGERFCLKKVYHN